jgi:hypothetical protein
MALMTNLLIINSASPTYYECVIEQQIKRRQQRAGSGMLTCCFFAQPETRLTDEDWPFCSGNPCSNIERMISQD